MKPQDRVLLGEKRRRKGKRKKEGKRENRVYVTFFAVMVEWSLPARLLGAADVENIPNGIFWMGKWLSALTRIHDMFLFEQFSLFEET